MMITRNLLLLFLVFWVVACGEKAISSGTVYSILGMRGPASAAKKADPSKMKEKAKEAYAYCKKKKYNQRFCILIDLGVHSGLNRFFIWDFKKDTISGAFPVSHGCCGHPWSFTWSKENAGFSNTDGSHCSSLGRYRIGERGYSDWGIHIKYLMHGLDPSNSNALARQIVLHSWESVPDQEQYPAGTPEGWGCPALSNSNMRKIDPLLKTSQQPVLMWVYK